MSHAMSPERRETYVARRQSEREKSNERKSARKAKATDHRRFSA